MQPCKNKNKLFREILQIIIIFENLVKLLFLTNYPIFSILSHFQRDLKSLNNRNTYNYRNVFRYMCIYIALNNYKIWMDHKIRLVIPCGLTIFNDDVGVKCFIVNVNWVAYIIYVYIYILLMGAKNKIVSEKLLFIERRNEL